MSESISDAGLIAATLAGDHDAFASIVARYQKTIFRVAFAIVRNEMEADLITQDVFVRAYMQLSKFEQRSELETWLTRIAINRSRDSLRAQRWLLPSWSHSDEKGTSVFPEPVDERPDAERGAMSREISAAIDRAVESLSNQQKMIFRLRHYEDLPLGEIARLMSLRPGTVRAHLFRAIRNIRRELSEWGALIKAPEETAS
jgi:RNA polymerase sigma-70 factor, ECF subfamily